MERHKPKTQEVESSECNSTCAIEEDPQVHPLEAEEIEAPRLQARRRREQCFQQTHSLPPAPLNTRKFDPKRVTPTRPSYVSELSRAIEKAKRAPSSTSSTTSNAKEVRAKMIATETNGTLLKAMLAEREESKLISTSMFAKKKTSITVGHEDKTCSVWDEDIVQAW